MKRGREKFAKYKNVFNILTRIISVLPFSMRKYLFTMIRGFKGTIGLVIRYILIKTLAKKCGDNVSIHPGVIILSPEKLTIGDNVSIHPWCYIDAVGEIEIGNDVSIAHGTTILSSTHNYQDDINIKDQGLSYKKTVINNNVWIGAKVTVIYGIIVKSGVVIGANSLVNKDIKENLIVGGVPAKIIKSR